MFLRFDRKGYGLVSVVLSVVQPHGKGPRTGEGPTRRNAERNREDRRFRDGDRHLLEEPFARNVFGHKLPLRGVPGIAGAVR